MNREIKFRVWNPDDNKMEYPLIFSTNEGFKGLIRCSDGNNAYKDYPVMQFTGLQDKNGKDIYEGDILKPNIDQFVTVEYDNGTYKGVCHFSETINHLSDFHTKHMKVVANVYENPLELNLEG